MVMVSVWGARHMSPETRIRARAGPTGIDWTLSKKTALVQTPVIGAIVLFATLVLHDRPSAETFALIGLAVMLIFLWAHWSSVRRAVHHRNA